MELWAIWGYLWYLWYPFLVTRNYLNTFKGRGKVPQAEFEKIHYLIATTYQNYWSYPYIVCSLYICRILHTTGNNLYVRKVKKMCKNDFVKKIKTLECLILLCQEEYPHTQTNKNILSEFHFAKLKRRQKGAIRYTHFQDRPQSQSGDGLPPPGCLNTRFCAGGLTYRVYSSGIPCIGLKWHLK